MQDAIYEAITDAQKAEAVEEAEALENAAAILCKRREITARYEKAATSTGESTGNRPQ